MSPAASPAERSLSRRREKYEAERERLMGAALTVMRERGTVDPTVADILAEAQLSTAAFYRLFPTKDDLLLALLERAGETTRSYLGHRLAREPDPTRRIVRWIEGMFDLLRTAELVERNRPFLLAHPRLVERFPAEISAMVSELVAPLAAAIGEVRRADGIDEGDPAADARLTHHLVFGVLVDRAAERRVRDRREVAAVVDYILRAVLRPPVT